MYNRGVPVKVLFDENDPNSRSRTHQSFAKDADINNIMAKYRKTGILVDPTLVNSARQPRFGDFSDIVDYASIVNRITQANADFMTLSAEVRAKFDNDVEKCLVFIADPKNLVEAVKLKLLPESMLPPLPKEPPKDAAAPQVPPPVEG